RPQLKQPGDHDGLPVMRRRGLANDQDAVRGAGLGHWPKVPVAICPSWLAASRFQHPRVEAPSGASGTPVDSWVLFVGSSQQYRAARGSTGPEHPPMQLARTALLLALLTSVNGLHAITYYLSPSGSDTNNGTNQATP